MRLLLVALCFWTIPALAQPLEPFVPTLIVTASGEATVRPDTATLELAVLRQAETAREALDANNKAMSAVLAAMKDFGIAAEDLQTRNFTIQPRYERLVSNSTRNPKIVGYDVSNGLTVRVRNLAKLGEVLDRSVSLGVNSGGGIRFSTSDPAAVIDAARRLAVENARAQAQTLTEAAGVRLGQVRSMSENSFQRPQPRQMFEARSANMADAVPVAAGENSYSVSVSITWALEQ